MAKKKVKFSPTVLAVKYGLTGLTIEDAVAKKRAGWSQANIEKYLVQLGLLEEPAKELTSLIVAEVDRELLRQHAPHLLDGGRSAG